jgi:hypothetical protein
MNDSNQQPDPNHNPQEPIAFCQNCSTILTHETIRKVGANVFCEPCLAARLASPPPPPGSAPGAPDPSGYGAAGYGPVNTGANPYGGAPFTPPPPAAPGAPNPGLAALLGLIPGVGAMYNEQYAKGLAHLLIFAVLVMFSHIAGIFGLFVFGWIAYMSVEAHHTAKARRDGTPLPNPFGLNDIGERMGFAQTFPRGQDVAAAAREAARDAAAYAAANFNRPNPQGPVVTPPPTQPPTWGAPTDACYTPPAYAPPFTQQPYTNHPPYTEPFMPPTAAAPPYTAPPYTVPPIPPVPPIPAQPRFPTGAVVLIGLGTLFLLGTMGVFHAIPGSALIGLFLLMLGAKNFYDRMSNSGAGLAYDGTPTYNIRVVHALSNSIWLLVVGFLFLLDSFHIFRWENSWPWIIIVVGVMMLAKRAAYISAAAAYAPPVYPPNGPPYTPPASEPIITPPPPASTETRSGNEGAL